MDRAKTKPESSKTGKRSFAFRLPLATEEEAIALAESQGLSVGELAKELLLDHLQKSLHCPVSIAQENANASKELLVGLERLNVNLRFTALAMLVECGDALPDEVEALLNEHWQ